MIKKQYTGSARRARNIIWNAAGRYDFDPPFMAFFPNGKPDNYFNMAAGLVQKWLDMPRLWDFFASYENDRRADEFDDLLWLGLENCVYEKELEERPILRQLRRARGEEFFREQQQLSRQQMEYQSMTVYTQQEYRWARACGRKAPLLSPREKRMAAALEFSGSLDTSGVLAAMEGFLRSFFRWQGPAESVPLRPAGALAKALLRHEHKRRDRLLVRCGTGEGDHDKARAQRHSGLGRFVGPTAEDEAYIRAVFGRCSLSEGERRILENELCVGRDQFCRLWVTRGEPTETDDRDALEVRESAARQRARNEAYFAGHSALIDHSVRALSTRLETVLSSYFRHLPEPSRSGRLRSEVAYRLPVLNDTRIFLRSGEETEQPLCVDLLLDASQSRMNSQEVLSAESYILAESLRKLHIPVRVSAFRSLRGFLVLEQLKDWSQSDCKGLLRYYAGGWNRDGLAVETLGRLNDSPVLQGRRRLLLVLTDASPNDSTPMAGEGLGLHREYEGQAAVTAAQEAVRALRASGVGVGAVFHGNTHNLPNAQQIYGHAYVRIQKAGQLSQGVSDLMLMLMRENVPLR